MAVYEKAPSTGEPVKLRRSLKLWQVIGLSIGLMAPSMAISINPQGAIGPVGRAIPLSFLISMVGALLVAYGFARLSQHFHNSGSVLGLVGATLGARAGVVAGWLIAGTYLLYALLVGVVAGIYGTIFLNDTGIISNQPSWLEYTIGGVAIVVAGFMAAVPISKATDIILSFEGVTITLIVIAAIVVLAKLLGHSGPGHLGFTWKVFVPAKGTTISNVFLGVVFGFLSFAGFESATTLGGEAQHPRKDIPRALFGTVVVIGIFYVVISAVEVMGFGTSAAGLKNFAASPALLGTLGRSYVAHWFGDLIILGTVISAFGCSIASVVGCSRLIYSFSRDGLGRDHPLAQLSPSYRTPLRATMTVVGAELVILVVMGGIVGTSPLNLFLWPGTIGTLLLLIAYVMVAIGALMYLFVGPRLRAQPMLARPVELAIPVLGILLLGYTIYRNVVPYPTGAAFWLPIIAAIWAVLITAYVVVQPGSSQRMGRELVLDEGVEEMTTRP